VQTKFLPPAHLSFYNGFLSLDRLLLILAKVCKTSKLQHPKMMVLPDPVWNGPCL